MEAGKWDVNDVSAERRAELLAFKRDFPSAQDGEAEPEEPIRPLLAWDVIEQNGAVCIDRVYFAPDMNAREVLDALVRHDGLSSTIRVRLSEQQASTELDDPCLCGDEVRRGCLQACRLNGEKPTIPDPAWRDAAVEVVTSDRLDFTEVLTDTNCKIANEEADGAYVQVWVWTPRVRAADFAYAAVMNARNLTEDMD